MKRMYWIITICLLLAGCASGKKMYSSNGAMIYLTGKNNMGQKMVNRKTSSIPIVKSCRACHGTQGDAMKNVSIRFLDLTDPTKFAVPYTDSLFYRFLDLDLKSDGTKANIGIRWKMSEQDKKDLWQYLQSL